MKTVAMVCQKGGTGKTTLALSLAVEAVRSGLNVVMVVNERRTGTPAESVCNRLI